MAQDTTTSEIEAEPDTDVDGSQTDDATTDDSESDPDAAALQEFETALGLENFLPDVPADESPKPKSDEAPALKLAGSEKEEASAPAGDDLPSDDDIKQLTEDLGDSSTKILKKLIDGVRSRDKTIKQLNDQLGGVSKYADLMGDLEKVRPHFADLGRVAQRENKAFMKDVNRALNAVAADGGAAFVGKNVADRKANWAKYQKNVIALLTKGEQGLAIGERRGAEKASLGDYIVAAWSYNRKRSGAASEPKAEGTPKTAAQAQQRAMAEQSRRGNPATANAAPKPPPQKRVSADTEAKSLVRQFLSLQNAAGAA